jgi:hypothetical protein
LNFTCTTYSAPAMAIRPGTAPETCELLGTVLVVRPGEPSEAWRLECWRKRFGRRVA